MSKVEPSTVQMAKWAGDFGRAYTDRNAMTLNEMEALYKNRFGLTRSELNEEFVSHLDRSIRILEVGSNMGNQLLCLQRMGFENLYGIELQWYAIEKAKAVTRGINLIQGSALDLPFKTSFFDLVFTSNVLIHIAPSDIREVLSEIYRCSRRWIWGIEYFSDAYEQVHYRGHDGLLWKTDFCKLYRETSTDLRLVKEKKYAYVDDDNVDVMFLLSKEG